MPLKFFNLLKVLITSGSSKEYSVTYEKTYLKFPLNKLAKCSNLTIVQKLAVYFTKIAMCFGGIDSRTFSFRTLFSGELFSTGFPLWEPVSGQKISLQPELQQTLPEEISSRCKEDQMYLF